MNYSKNREEAKRSARYDFDKTIQYIQEQEEPRDIATSSGDEIDYTTEWLYQESGDVTVETTLTNTYATEKSGIVMDNTPILGFGGKTGSLDTAILDDVSPDTVENPIDIYSPDPLYGDYGGTIEGWADIPSGADRELFTTFENVSVNTYSKLVETKTLDDGSIIEVFEPYVEVSGSVGASSGTVDAFLEEDIYYFQGSGSVDSIGAFNFEFKKPDSYDYNAMRLRHPNTREWEPYVEGDYIYSDYRVDVYRELDTDYYIGDARVFVDGNTWSVNVDAPSTDALIEIELTKNGSQYGKPWRRAYNVYDILDDYEVVVKQVTVGAIQDRAPVASNGDFVFAARDLRYPYRIWIEQISTGDRVTPKWHVDSNGTDIYSNLYVASFVTADRLYEVDRVPLAVSGEVGTYKEAFQQLTTKLIYNEDEYTEAYDDNDVVYAATQSVTRMPISYDVDPDDTAAYTSPFSNRSYSYDIALALLCYVFDGNQARASDYADTLIRLIKDNGMFVFFASQGQYSGLTPYERTGAAAWCDYALARYVKKYPGAANADQAEAACRSNLDRIIREYEVTDTTAKHYGCYRGGVGRYTPNDEGVYVFDPDYDPPWTATEHMVDMFFAFQAAADAFGDANYDSRADDVYTDMIDVLWSEDKERFIQGATADTIDDRGALDVHSWGSVVMNQNGDIDRRDKALARLPVYKTFNSDQGVYGYPPYVEEEGHPGAGDVVWFEGSFGVVHALRRAGREAEALALGHQMSAVNVGENNSYRYAARGDTENTVVVPYPALASSTWGILAMKYPDKMWSETP